MNERKPIEEILSSGKKVSIETVNLYGNKIITKAIVQEMNAQGLMLNLQKQERIFNQVHTNADIKIICYDDCNAGICEPMKGNEYVSSSKFIKIREDGELTQLILSVPILSSADDPDGKKKSKFTMALPFSYFIDDKEVKGGTVKDLATDSLVAFVKADPSLEVGLGLPFKLSLPTSANPFLIIGTITGLTQQTDCLLITLDFSHIPHDIQDQITKYLFSLPKPIAKKELQQKLSFIKIK